ncbi:MAG: glycoside hydrolase family 88 protein [Oscillospiraceae bacterium]|nr:glycoside hydrolase family 88 protein [Oscillospiraceae bacterium]
MNPEIQKIFDLADASVQRFAPEKLYWSWGQALMLYALARIDQAHGTEKYTDYLRRYYDHHIRKGYRLCSSDTSAPALGALYLALKTGEERYCEVVKEAKRYYGTAKRILEDMPNHHGTALEGRFYPKSIWIDSIMMYGVFTNWLASVSQDEAYASLRCEAAAQDEALRNFAVRQPANFARYLQDPETGFFYHSYWTRWKTTYPRQPIFWGRGNGWVMAAVPLLLEHLPAEHQPQVIEFFVRLAAALLPCQRADGYFETVINRPGETYKESSATMLIAAGWFYGYRTGLLDETYYDAAVKAFHAVTSDLQIKDGLLSMPYISGGTMPMPGIPYFNYKHTPLGNDRHFGLATAFFAALEYERCEVQK